VRLHRPVEGVGGHHLEIGVRAHQRAEPGVFELLAPPVAGERRPDAGERRAAGFAGRGAGGAVDIEQRAVGVEDDEACAHRFSPWGIPIAWKPPSTKITSPVVQAP
jgi:hypothetical protein